MSVEYYDSYNNSSSMFSGRKVKWNHFGKKYSLRLSDYELEYADLYDAFMKKVHEIRPDFEGAIAYIDQYGRQVIVNNDKDLREALSQSKGKLKLHTTLADGQIMSAVQVAGRQTRSHSVPPPMDRGYHSYPPNSRSPSSMDSAPPTYRNRTASPPPAPLTTYKKPPLSPGTYNEIPMKPPGYGYSYSTYAPYYSQNLLYGMPPHSGMLLRFLASPFPFGYHKSFVGPNKYHHFGGPWGGYRYYSPGWG
ncbi:unnamed protein product, partial [Cylicocyclus nassatus]